jgi:outer membrane protein TolC
VNENFDASRQLAAQRLGADVKWLTTDEARRQAQADIDALLGKPLSMDDAVRIALAYSPALQAMLFDAASVSAQATQSARLPNPLFTFERLVRGEGEGHELEIGRALGLSVVDLLALPARRRIANARQQQVRLQMAGDVVRTALEARHAWVQALAAEQALKYFRQVKAAADASAELARRMQSTGNFSRLQRSREQAFAAEAVAQVARAQRSAQGARETLVRILGLNAEQARALKLPDRLPDLPSTVRDERSVMQDAIDRRLDVLLAKAELDTLARSQGLTRVTSIVNGFEIAGVRNSETGNPTQKGYELEIPLPIFDFGDARRTDAKARYMAALNRAAAVAASATSEVRDAYHGYRTAHDLARHYRDEIVPLRKTIAEENLLRYNGMLIGVFELLADAREQIGSVAQALEAERDFWLADAALQGALIGTPTAGVQIEAAPSPAVQGGGGH